MVSIPCRVSGGTSVSASSYPGSVVEGSAGLSGGSDFAIVLVVPHVVDSSPSVSVSVAGRFAARDGSKGS